MIHVIFICTGNICRSAMAEGYLKYRIKELGLEEKVIVTSAGINAKPGEEATPFAKLAIKYYNADIQKHVATHVENSNINQADYILVMTKRHKEDIIRKYPSLNEKVHLLKEYDKTETYLDIDDPWGYSMETYETIAKEIVKATEGFIEKELM